MTSPIDPARHSAVDAARDAERDAALESALRALHREVLTEPLPPALQQAALQLQARQRAAWRGRQGLGLAAGVLLAFGMGWLAHGRFGAAPEAELAGPAVAHEFVRQARFAYRVYQPEKRHPVEVAASDEAHLVQWLSKRLGKPLKLPSLEAQGFALVGGRLLPGDAGARAQFMFQDAQERRITLYLGALDGAGHATNQATQATQFRYEPDGSVPSFYWAEQGFGYALSGQVDQATLMAVARSVYAQVIAQ